jgi:hypothetical protein
MRLFTPQLRLWLIAALAALTLGIADDASAQNFPGGSWRQSCRDARMEGRDTLRAECQRRNGTWNRSSIDIDRCGQGGTVANNDGNLVCQSQGGGSTQGNNQNFPPGSWRQSCREARMEGRDTLRAECRTADGRWNRTGIDTDRCGRNGPVANRNGELVCENQAGQGGGGWWGQGLPPGSYRQSCRNARMESRDDLVAECRRSNGNWRQTKLDIDPCRGRDIVNDNGHLECGDHRYSGNYGRYQMPGGSWQQSCRNARIVRDELIAECRQRDGDWIRDTIDLDECRGQPLHNENGRLRCGAFGGQTGQGGNYMPAGSWRESCRNPRTGNDGRFYADCRQRDGGWNNDGIELRQCQGRPIYNDDGKLRC